MARSRLVALLTALALVAPASAFAQSAGDEQYQDPFGGDDQQQSSGDSSSGSAGTTAQATPTPTVAATSPSTTATATAAQAAPAAQQLPRTGGDPITPAVAGFWLLLGGVALRARLRPRDDGRA
jgi:hypothetical protein